MDITKRLVSLDPTLIIHDEGEWSKTKTPYTAFNDAGVECEVGEFLYSLVRVLKPERILETGTHWGIGASYMGMAQLDNGIGGKVHTIEFLPEIYNRALERFGKLGLHNVIESYLMDARQFDPGTAKYQLILLDTEPQTRFAEFEKFFDYLDEGGFIFIHDLHRHMNQVENLEHGFAWPFGKVPPRMMSLIKSGAAVPFHFPTPRGLTGFYKVHRGDYGWEKEKINLEVTQK